MYAVQWSCHLLAGPSYALPGAPESAVSLATALLLEKQHGGDSRRQEQ
jgi:hypothetical protein